MSQIVAGNFPNKAQADSAIQALLSAGIGAAHICTFRVNPADQPATFPIGGDEYAFPVATEAGSGALSGADIGSVVGLGAGVLVAVEAPLALERAFAADVLKQRGARNVEETEGVWEDGSWVDFDATPEKPANERS